MKPLIGMFAIALLSSCGGGGGDAATPAPAAPAPQLDSNAIANMPMSGFMMR